MVQLVDSTDTVSFSSVKRGFCSRFWNRRRPRRRPRPLDFEDESEDDDEDGQTGDIKGRSPCLISLSVG